MTSDQAVEVLRAAGEATRLRILALLAREELAVLEITRILGQSQPRVSRHLKLLADAGLVERFPDGAWVFYRLARGGPARGVVDQALALIAPDDPGLLRDAERLIGVSAERTAQAGAYFAENAEHWDEIRSLYVAENAVEAAAFDLKRVVKARAVILGEEVFQRRIEASDRDSVFLLRLLTLFGVEGVAVVTLGLRDNQVTPEGVGGHLNLLHPLI